MSLVRRRVLRGSLLGLLGVLSVAGGGVAQTLTVFAAASLTNAFEDLAPLWRQRGAGDVRFSFAASSALARQIENGAPADVFVSADESWMSYLAERRLIVAETRATVLGNRLVLIAPADRAMPPVEIKPGFPILALIGDSRLATGDPDHVPVGKYARDAFTRLGVWDAVAPRLARADNVRVALTLVDRGEASLGVVYETDAAASRRVKVVAAFPPDSHPPIVYPMAVVAGRDGAAARAFLALVASQEAEPVFRRHGFVLRQ